MMCREGVLNVISEEKRKYYENFMCRLALNGESHMEERVYALNTITPYFTKQEKVQTAKWRKRSIPTHSNGSIHSLLSPKIGLRSA